MEDERKNYMLYLSRIAKREVSFSDVGDYLVSQFATTDNYSTDFQIFTLNGLSVGVENDLLSEALRELPDKKREILLLIVKATDGDTEAINQILHHYRGYITKRSLRLSWKRAKPFHASRTGRFVIPPKHIELSMCFDRLTSHCSLKTE